MYFGQFGIIDGMQSAEEISDHINAMSPDQRLMHACLTGTIDVIYPFVYSAFFIGIAIKYFGRLGIWLAVPSILVVPVDLVCPSSYKMAQIIGQAKREFLFTSILME